MKSRQFLGLLILITCLLTPVWAETAAEKLEQAWEAEDEKQVCKLYAPGIWETEEDGGEGLFRQILRKKLKFKLVGEHSRDNRVVAVYDVWRQDRKVDRVFTFLVDDKVWAHTENKAHSVHFFEGRVLPRIGLSDFPGTPELSELGRQFLQGKSTGNTQVDGVLKEESSYTFTSSHSFDQLGRALIVYGENEYGVILDLEDEKWKVTDFVYGPDGKDILPRVTEYHAILAD